MANLANLTFPITKRTRQADGSVIVEGPVTDDSLDLDGQIVDAKSAAKALQEWFDDHANVRQQHSPILAPAGKGLSLTFESGVPVLKAHIVEPTAVKLVNAGVYDSYSIGIADGTLDTSSHAKRKAPNGVLFPSLVNEVSIVDYPANVSMGKFSIAKRRKNGVIEETQKNKVYDPRFRNLDGDSLVEALKSARGGAIVYTAASPKEAHDLIGTQFPSNEYMAEGNVIITKRHVDPNVGGGVDRDKVPKKDFAGPNKTYPIVTPGDVSDAAALIGKADNPDVVKANIIRIAQRKGPEFVAELPKKWRNEMGKSQKSKKVEKAPGEKKPPFPGAAKPFTSKKDDETPEEKAARKEKKAAKKAAKAAKAAKPDDDADEKVTQDIDAAGAAIDEAKKDQAVDTAGDSDDKDTSKAKSEKGAKKKLSKAARRMAKEAAKAKSAAEKESVAAMKRAHDVLCPLYRGSYAKSLGSVTDVIDPEMFRARLMEADESSVETHNARKSAYSAAAQIATMKVRDLDSLRRLAHKAFKDSYPNLKVASPDLSDPSSFQRGFIPSANKETATSTSKPGNFPDAKPLKAEQFTRGPLTVNEARPSLVGGTPAASMKGRAFYTNAAKDANENAMAILHDHISENYPTVCPAGQFANETGDRLGTPPEMYSHAPSTAAIPDKADSSLSAVAVKRAANQAVGKAVKPLVRKNKKQAKAIKSLEKKLRKELAKPDYTKSAHRRTDFAAISGGAVTDLTEKKKERLERAKMLSSRIHDRNSGTSQDAISELQELVTPGQFAALMTADE